MNMKKTVIGVLALALVVGQLTGCAGTTQEEMNSLVSSEPTIEIEVPTLSEETETPEETMETEEVVVKEEALPLLWTILGRNSTYPEFRRDINDALGIENHQGSIFVDLEGNHEMNNTLYNALRNKVFIQDQLENADIKEELELSTNEIFTDLEVDDIMAAMFNSYWSLLPDESGEDVTEFKGSTPLTRAQAMTLVMRAITPVTESGKPDSNSEFTQSVGETIYTDYASYMNDKCYINTSDSSLVAENFNSSMTRAEYIYMVMNTVYGTDAINSYDVSKVELSDCKDGGSIAETQGYTGTNGCALNLDFMVNNPNGGLETSMYKAVAMASDLAIIPAETRWDEAVTKTEAIDIFVAAVKTLTPTTEETSGINEEELREHGKQWYAEYKDMVTCDEETFINSFVSFVIGGLEEPDAANEVYLTYMKVVLQEPEPIEPYVPPVEETPVEDTKPAEETPVQTTKPAEETKPEVKDYSDIKWGDPIPDNMTNVYGKKAQKAKWVEKEGGKFVKINGRYYYSIEDWANGAEALDMEVVDGITLAEQYEQGAEPIEWQ